MAAILKQWDAGIIEYAQVAKSVSVHLLKRSKLGWRKCFDRGVVYLARRRSCPKWQLFICQAGCHRPHRVHTSFEHWKMACSQGLFFYSASVDGQEFHCLRMQEPDCNALLKCLQRICTTVSMMQVLEWNNIRPLPEDLVQQAWQIKASIRTSSSATRGKYTHLPPVPIFSEETTHSERSCPGLVHDVAKAENNPKPSLQETGVTSDCGKSFLFANHAVGDWADVRICHDQASPIIEDLCSEAEKYGFKVLCMRPGVDRTLQQHGIASTGNETKEVKPICHEREGISKHARDDSTRVREISNDSNSAARITMECTNLAADHADDEATFDEVSWDHRTRKLPPGWEMQQGSRPQDKIFLSPGRTTRLDSWVEVGRHLRGEATRASKSLPKRSRVETTSHDVTSNEDFHPRPRLYGFRRTEVQALCMEPEHDKVQKKCALENGPLKSQGVEVSSSKENRASSASSARKLVAKNNGDDGKERFDEETEGDQSVDEQVIDGVCMAQIAEKSMVSRDHRLRELPRHKISLSPSRTTLCTNLVGGHADDEATFDDIDDLIRTRKLPPGWEMQQGSRPRDKIFLSPGRTTRLDSWLEVGRHLRGEETRASKSRQNLKRNASSDTQQSAQKRKLINDIVSDDSLIGCTSKSSRNRHEEQTLPSTSGHEEQTLSSIDSRRSRHGSAWQRIFERRFGFEMR